jgi:large conductance mechanosensitive channel
MIKDFKNFAFKGNVVDLAVGFIMGVAFAAIVNSLVKDIIMPPIGLLLGNVDFNNLFVLLKEGATAGPYLSLAEAQAAGAVTINYGAFINLVIVFIIVALVLFFLVRSYSRAKTKFEKPVAAGPAPEMKECPYCLSSIPKKASRCPNCTSELKG